MPFATVCISGEDGAGAAEAAQAAAQALGLRVIDEDIITKAAIEAGVEREVVADVEQSRSKLVRLLESMSGMATLGTGYAVADPAAYGQPASDALRGLIRSVIEDTAATGGVMIVSHAASLALADRPDVLRVLITAPPEVRGERLAGSSDLGGDEALKQIRRSDSNRADYIKRFYDVDSEQATHYDLVINTDRVPPQQAAALIVSAAG
ncbi:MAG TPA: cytidylate kinase-like family protein [Solirubrobacteraceae bacterium]|jgi:cytidylate kinase|nr:cytidylate kinase-like family protein [Solirubrobacteraceae bacterium]